MNKVFALFTALLLFAASFAATAAARVDIVIPAGNPLAVEIAQTVRQGLQQSPAVAAVSIRTDSQLHAAERGALAITIGDPMLSWVFEPDNPYPARLAFYANAGEFRRAGATPSNVSAIYSEQPLQRQLQLAKLLLPNLQRVAVVYRAQAAPDLPALRRASGLAVNGASVDADTNWARTLSLLLGENDILLGLEDRALYNRDTIRSVLLTTYRHGKVLIGPSQAFVTAGSLASCYTTPEQFMQQLRAAVEFYFRHGALPAPAYPEHYRVAINRQVAASLGVELPDQRILINQMPAGGECGDGC